MACNCISTLKTPQIQGKSKKATKCCYFWKASIIVQHTPTSNFNFPIPMQAIPYPAKNQDWDGDLVGTYKIILHLLMDIFCCAMNLSSLFLKIISPPYFPTVPLSTNRK